MIPKPTAIYWLACGELDTVSRGTGCMHNHKKIYQTHPPSVISAKNVKRFTLYHAPGLSSKELLDDEAAAPIVSVGVFIMKNRR